jgi:septal ring factor EnvC (AmiA/AmiB activator)
MTELIALFMELKSVFGGAVAIGLAAALYFLSQKNSRDMAAADSAGQIKALAVYEEMLKAEREARAQAEQRADKFGEERNEAYQELYKLQGQMSELTKQIERQNGELERLRAQISKLEEQIHANPRL